MIIGTSHISFSTFNIKKDIEEYCNKGFSLTFLDEHVENHSEKKPYLNNYISTHSIAVLAGKSGIDIELVEHQKEKATDKKNINIDAVFGDGYVKQVEYSVQKLDESISFWQDFMGFAITQSENNFSILKKESMFPKWNCIVKLSKTDKDFDEPKLDYGGATAIAFFTTNLAKTMETFFHKYDLFGTKTFQLNVNDKDLDIALLSGPSKEIIELIQIKK
jgi:hypothetical protein